MNQHLRKEAGRIGAAAGLGNRNYNALSYLGDYGGEFSNAQNNGLSFGTYKDKEEEEKVSNFNFALNVGYFVSDGLMLGFSMSYSSIAGKDVGYKNKYSALTIGPLMRYYYDLGLIKLTFEGSIGFGTLKNKFKDDGDIEIYKESLFSISGGSGISILLNEHISLEAQGLFDRLFIKDEDGDELSQGKFGVRIGFGIFL